MHGNKEISFQSRHLLSRYSISSCPIHVKFSFWRCYIYSYITAITHTNPLGVIYTKLDAPTTKTNFLKTFYFFLRIRTFLEF